MKKFAKILGFIALVAVTVFSMTTCEDSGGGGSGGGGKGGKGDKGLFAVDISKNTDWDYMVGSKAGEAVLFRTNKSNGMPKEMYLKQDKDSDDGFTILFDDDGLPQISQHHGYTFIYHYLKDHKFDVAIINPDNIAEYHFNIQTDIDFEAYGKRTASAQGRSVGGDIVDVLMPDNVLEALGLVGDIVTCLMSSLVPPAVVPCVKFLAGTALEVLVVHYLDDLPEDVAKLVLNAYKCVDGAIIDNPVDVFGIPGAAADCISVFSGLVDMLFKIDKVVIDGKFTEVNDSWEIMTGGYRDYDIVVTVLSTNANGLDLNIIVPPGGRPGTHAGSFVLGGQYYWPKGTAAAGTYKVTVHPIWSMGLLKAEVKIFAFGRCKVFRGEMRQGLDGGADYVVATFDTNGIYGSGN